MGKWRSGLRGWWQGVMEWTHKTVTTVMESIIKPTFSRFATETRNIIDKRRTERETEFLLGLLSWGIIAGAVAARLSLLPEFLVGIVTGVAIIAAWARSMETRSLQRRSAIAAAHAEQPRQSSSPPKSETGKSSSPAKSKPGKSSSQPKSKPSKGSSQPKSQPGQSNSPPKSEPGKSGSPPESEPGKSNSPPKAETEKSSSPPKAEPEKSSSQPNAEPGQNSSQPKGKPGESSSQPKAEAGEKSPQPTGAPGESNSPPKAEPEDSNSQPKAEAGESSSQPKSEPGESEPPKAEPEDSNSQPKAEAGESSSQPKSEPGESEPPKSEPGESEPPKSEPEEGSSQPKPEPPKSEPGESSSEPKSEPKSESKSEPPKSGPGESSSQPKPEQPKSEPGESSSEPKSEPPKAEPGESSSQPKPEPPKSEPGESSAQPKSEPGESSTQPKSEVGESSSPPKSGYEKVEWMNKLLKKVWPYLAAVTEDARPSICDCIEPFLEIYRLGMYRVVREQPDELRVERYVPVKEVISSLFVNNISAGNIAPTIEGLKVHKLKNGKVTVNVRMRWESNSQIALGVGTRTGTIPIVLENLKIQATFRIILRITESPPFVVAIVTTIPAERKPTFDFSLRVDETSNSILPSVTKHLRDLVSNVILDSLLWPHRLVFPTWAPPKKEEALDLNPLYLRLHGQLSVAVIKGDNLVNLYAYVIIFCRPKFKLRTISVENTHHPEWYEEFTLDVEDQATQSLTLQIMNENKGADELVGTAEYPLKNLPLDKDVEIELSVHPKKKSRIPGLDPKKKSFGSITVEIRYHVYTDSEREAAIKAEESLDEALAKPDEKDSYSTAIDLIHPY